MADIHLFDWFFTLGPGFKVTKQSNNAWNRAKLHLSPRVSWNSFNMYNCRNTKLNLHEKYTKLKMKMWKINNMTEWWYLDFV